MALTHFHPPWKTGTDTCSQTVLIGWSLVTGAACSPGSRKALQHAASGFWNVMFELTQVCSNKQCLPRLCEKTRGSLFPRLISADAERFLLSCLPVESSKFLLKLIFMLCGCCWKQLLAMHMAFLGPSCAVYFAKCWHWDIVLRYLHRYNPTSSNFFSYLLIVEVEGSDWELLYKRKSISWSTNSLKRNTMQMQRRVLFKVSWRWRCH